MQTPVFIRVPWFPTRTELPIIQYYQNHIFHTRERNSSPKSTEITWKLFIQTNLCDKMKTIPNPRHHFIMQGVTLEWNGWRTFYRHRNGYTDGIIRICCVLMDRAKWYGNAKIALGYALYRYRRRDPLHTLTKIFYISAYLWKSSSVIAS